MTRSTHLPHPSPDEVRALLSAAGLSAYAAAKNLPIGVSANMLQKALKGERQLSGQAWRLIQITLTQSARDDLPPPIIKGMP